MKIGKMCILELPKSSHREGRLETFGKPCPEVSNQLEPTPSEPINAHKRAGGQGIPSKLPSFG